jgi:hypothetical protein
MASGSDLLEEEIDSLTREQFDGRVFWNHVRQINDLFKSTKLPPEDRERLWNKLSMECDTMKRVQDSRKNAVQAQSQNWFESIRHDVLSAKVCTLFGFNNPDIEEMKRLSIVLRDAGQELSEHKTEMTFQHKQELFQLIQEVRQEQDAWWESLKKTKEEDYRERIKANIAKNNNQLRHQVAALDRHETARDNLQSKIDDSDGGNWKDRAIDEYMPELEAKIDDIKESIRRIEGWIEEDEAKL